MCSCRDFLPVIQLMLLMMYCAGSYLILQFLSPCLTHLCTFCSEVAIIPSVYVCYAGFDAYNSCQTKAIFWSCTWWMFVRGPHTFLFYQSRLYFVALSLMFIYCIVSSYTRCQTLCYFAPVLWFVNIVTFTVLYLIYFRKIYTDWFCICRIECRNWTIGSGPSATISDSSVSVQY